MACCEPPSYQHEQKKKSKTFHEHTQERGGETETLPQRLACCCIRGDFFFFFFNRLQLQEVAGKRGAVGGGGWRSKRNSLIRHSSLFPYWKGDGGIFSPVLNWRSADKESGGRKRGENVPLFPAGLLWSDRLIFQWRQFLVLPAEGDVLPINTKPVSALCKL